MTTSPVAPATQTVHPWRATIRTLFALLAAIATVVPYIVTGAGLDATAIGAQVVVVATTITRVLAIPQVNAFLERWVFTAWLAAAPALKPAPLVDGAYQVTDVGPSVEIAASYDGQALADAQDQLDALRAEPGDRAEDAR